MSDQKTGSGRLPPSQFQRLRVEQDVVETFESLYTRDYAELFRKHFHPDGVMTVNWPAHLAPGGGIHRGMENAIGAMRLFLGEFEVTGSAVEDIVVDRSHVVVRYTQAVRHIGTGRSGQVSGMNHYVLDEERRCVSFSIFLDNVSLATIGDMIDAYAAISRDLENARRFRGQGVKDDGPA